MSSPSRSRPHASPVKGKGRGAGQYTSQPSQRPDPPSKRARVPTPPPAEERFQDVDMDSVHDDDNNNADSGGSVYRSEQYAQFLLNAPLLHHHAATSIVEIQLNNFDPVLSAMYRSFINTGYASAISFAPISEANFLKVSKLCIKARLDHVYMKVIGPVNQDRVNINQAPPMPKCLAEIVNSLGAIAAWDQNLLISPRAIAEAVEPNDRVHRTPAQVINSFRLFTTNLARKGFTTAVPISRADEGTRAWLLQARDITRNPIVTATGNAPIVTCRSQIDGVTPADIMLASLTQSQFDGAIPPFNFFVYESDVIAGIPTLRTSFFLSK